MLSFSWVLISAPRFPLFHPLVKTPAAYVQIKIASGGYADPPKVALPGAYKASDPDIIVSDKEPPSSFPSAPAHSWTIRSTSTTDSGTSLSPDLPCGTVEDFKCSKSLFLTHIRGRISNAIPRNTHEQLAAGVARPLDQGDRMQSVIICSVR